MTGSVTMRGSGKARWTAWKSTWKNCKREEPAMASQSASARKTAEMQLESGFVLEVSRRLKAPPALVFKMFADGAHLVRWFGPEGHTCLECTVEPRVGGRFYAALQGPDGITRRVQGIFTEV